MTTTDTTTLAPTLTGTYELDPAHSRIGFVARHAMVTKVRGAFTDVTGSGRLDAEDPANSSFEVTIRAASIDTNNADRDAHLRSNDFLDMDNHPTITFASTDVEPRGSDRFAVTGDLSIRGTTEPISFEVELTGPATDPFGNQRIGLEGRTEVNRKDWGVSWNATLDAGGVLVSDQVTLEFDVSAIRTDEAA